MSKPQQIRVLVVETEEYDTNWPGVGLVALTEWCRKHLASIPIEHRHTATWEISSREDYDDSRRYTIAFYYYRPETKEDRVARSRETREAADAVRLAELTQLAKLKAKYEQ